MENKNDYLKMILKNPRALRIITEGWDAPLGSTKRSKARTILMVLNKRKKELYNLICVEWDYYNKRDDYSDSITLTVALADFLILCTLEIPSPIAVTVLLVQRGLNKFC